MFKKLLSGLVFGSGVALAFAVIYTVFAFWIWPLKTQVTNSDPDVVVNTHQLEQSRPAVPLGDGDYLGPIVDYSGNFQKSEKKILNEGPGSIDGLASVSGDPATGLKVRLALNGGVVSRWAEVDSEGRYAIKVPYGEYRNSGFEIDSVSADQVLAGKILHPSTQYSGDLFLVSEKSPGKGIEFVFIDPVRLSISKKEFSGTEDILIEWSPYPGALQYGIQVYEFEKPGSSGKVSKWFEADERPQGTGNSIYLGQLGHRIRAGYYYIIEIEALDGNSEVISKTPLSGSGYDIHITK